LILDALHDVYTEAIVPGLIQHAGWDGEAILRNCSGAKSAVRAEFEKRLARIAPELNEPLR
jgi:hypothetical protein